MHPSLADVLAASCPNDAHGVTLHFSTGAEASVVDAEEDGAGAPFGASAVRADVEPGDATGERCGGVFAASSHPARPTTSATSTGTRTVSAFRAARSLWRDY